MKSFKKFTFIFIFSILAITSAHAGDSLNVSNDNNIVNSSGYAKCYDNGQVIFEGIVKAGESLTTGFKFFEPNGDVILISAPCVYIGGANTESQFQDLGGK